MYKSSSLDEKQSTSKNLDILYIFDGKINTRYVNYINDTLKKRKEQDPSFNYHIIGDGTRKVTSEEIENELQSNNLTVNNKTLAIIDSHGSAEKISKGEYKKHSNQHIVDTLDRLAEIPEEHAKMNTCLLACQAGVATPGEKTRLFAYSSQKYPTQGKTQTYLAKNLVNMVKRGLPQNEELADIFLDSLLNSAETLYIKEKDSSKKITGPKKVSQELGYDLSDESLKQHMENNVDEFCSSTHVSKESDVYKSKISSINPDSIAKYRNSTLSVASTRGNMEKAEAALKSGANPDYSSETDSLPIYHAIMKNNNQMLKLLLNNGASPYIKDERGKTPIYNAAFRGQMDNIKDLLEAGASPDQGFQGINIATRFAAAQGKTINQKTYMQFHDVLASARKQNQSRQSRPPGYMSTILNEGPKGANADTKRPPLGRGGR